MPAVIHHLIVLRIAAATAGASGRWKPWECVSSRTCVLRRNATFALVMDTHMGYERVATEKTLGAVGALMHRRENVSISGGLLLGRLCRLVGSWLNVLFNSRHNNNIEDTQGLSATKILIQMSKQK